MGTMGWAGAQVFLALVLLPLGTYGCRGARQLCQLRNQGFCPSQGPQEVPTE